MSEPPQPRQCLVKKWPDFDGYGFNLHAEKNKPGQFIGKIDPGSPAEAAGLKEGDRIVEVNGVNVNQENHKQVVQRIKAVLNETNLLVVDKKCEEFHKQNEIIVKSSLSYVLHLSSEKEEEIIDDEEVIDTRLQEVSIEDHQEEDDDVQDSISESSSSPPPSVHNGSVEREDSMMSNRSSVISTKTPNSLSSGSPRSTPSPTLGKVDGLDLNITAKEMRERIGSRKKRDPRKDNRMDFRKKHEIIQTL
eukprot:GFUD01097920.1.p1 GENE.GFUD01097920.1~~GFUD01097920.1.p1  ORF type:complete len:248 (+),score=77.07 GFUD01097920.1:61-804(+)